MTYVSEFKRVSKIIDVNKTILILNNILFSLNSKLLNVVLSLTIQKAYSFLFQGTQISYWELSTEQISFNNKNNEKENCQTILLIWNAKLKRVKLYVSFIKHYN